MRRSSVAKGAGSVSMVATDMPQQLSISAVSGPPASTPVSGLPTNSSRQSSCMEPKPRRTAMIFSPSALLCGMESENHCWKKAIRCWGSLNGLVTGLLMALFYNPIWRAARSFMISTEPPPIDITLVSR